MHTFPNSFFGMALSDEQEFQNLHYIQELVDNNDLMECLFAVKILKQQRICNQIQSLDKNHHYYEEMLETLIIEIYQEDNDCMYINEQGHFQACEQHVRQTFLQHIHVIHESSDFDSKISVIVHQFVQYYSWVEKQRSIQEHPLQPLTTSFYFDLNILTQLINDSNLMHCLFKKQLLKLLESCNGNSFHDQIYTQHIDVIQTLIVEVYQEEKHCLTIDVFGHYDDCHTHVQHLILSHFDQTRIDLNFNHQIENLSVTFTQYYSYIIKEDYHQSHQITQPFSDNNFHIQPQIQQEIYELNFLSFKQLVFDDQFMNCFFIKILVQQDHQCGQYISFSENQKTYIQALEFVVLQITNSYIECYKNLQSNSILFCEEKIEDLLISHFKFTQIETFDNDIVIISESIVTYLELTQQYSLTHIPMINSLQPNNAVKQNKLDFGANPTIIGQNQLENQINEYKDENEVLKKKLQCANKKIFDLNQKALDHTKQEQQLENLTKKIDCIQQNLQKQLQLQYETDQMKKALNKDESLFEKVDKNLQNQQKDTQEELSDIKSIQSKLNDQIQNLLKGFNEILSQDEDEKSEKKIGTINSNSVTDHEFPYPKEISENQSDKSKEDLLSKNQPQTQYNLFDLSKQQTDQTKPQIINNDKIVTPNTLSNQNSSINTNPTQNSPLKENLLIKPTNDLSIKPTNDLSTKPTNDLSTKPTNDLTTSNPQMITNTNPQMITNTNPQMITNTNPSNSLINNSVNPVQNQTNETLKKDNSVNQIKTPNNELNVLITNQQPQTLNPQNETIISSTELKNNPIISNLNLSKISQELPSQLYQNSYLKQIQSQKDENQIIQNDNNPVIENKISSDNNGSNLIVTPNINNDQQVLSNQNQESKIITSDTSNPNSGQKTQDTPISNILSNVNSQQQIQTPIISNDTPQQTTQQSNSPITQLLSNTNSPLQTQPEQNKQNDVGKDVVQNISTNKTDKDEDDERILKERNLSEQLVQNDSNSLNEISLLNQIQKVSSLKNKIEVLEDEKHLLIEDLVENNSDYEFKPFKERLEQALKEQGKIDQIQEYRRDLNKLKFELTNENSKLEKIMNKLKNHSQINQNRKLDIDQVPDFKSKVDSLSDFIKNNQRNLEGMIDAKSQIIENLMSVVGYNDDKENQDISSIKKNLIQQLSDVQFNLMELNDRKLILTKNEIIAQPTRSLKELDDDLQNIINTQKQLKQLSKQIGEQLKREIERAFVQRGEHAQERKLLLNKLQQRERILRDTTIENRGYKYIL